MIDPEKNLKELGLSESETTVYLSMVAGSTNARDLLKVTKMKRPTVYYALSSLEKRGLISKSKKENDSTFTISPTERLVAIARERESEAMILTEKIGELAPLLSKKQSSKNTKPQVSFFEGVEAVRRVVMDTMYAKDKNILCIAPSKNFFWNIGEDFVKNFVEERIKRNIHARNLWEREIEKSVFKKYYDKSASVHILPSVMKDKFSTTIFMFDNSTLYVSSIKECYAILVTSPEHTDTMRAIFEGLCSASKPHAK